MAEDLYQTLGVDRDVDKTDLQKAYRKLARKFHPDMNPDNPKAQEKFKRVQEAYDVLSDADKRAAYDRYGSDFEKIRGGGFRPGAGSSGGPSFDGLDLEQIFGAAGRGGGGGAPGGGFENGFNDFFEQILGGGGAGGRGPRGGAPRQPPARGSNLRHELSIPFAKSVLGGKVEFYVARGGQQEKLSVAVPAGIDDGAKIRLREQGQSGPGGAGDLILIIRVDEHPFYKRHGNHLEIKLPITLAEAALGAKVDLPTPRGTLTISIPPNSSSGKRLRLKGQGVAPEKGDPGDVLVELQIKLPESIDEASAELIRQFDDANPIEPRATLSF